MRRDPKNRDHKMTKGGAAAIAPNFYLEQLLHRDGTPQLYRSECGRIRNSSRHQWRELRRRSLDALKTYVTWHMLRNAAPWLSKPYVEARTLSRAEP